MRKEERRGEARRGEERREEAMRENGTKGLIISISKVHGGSTQETRKQTKSEISDQGEVKYKSCCETVTSTTLLRSNCFEDAALKNLLRRACLEELASKRL